MDKKSYTFAESTLERAAFPPGSTFRASLKSSLASRIEAGELHTEAAESAAERAAVTRTAAPRPFTRRLLRPAIVLTALLALVTTSFATGFAQRLWEGLFPSYTMGSWFNYVLVPEDNLSRSYKSSDPIIAVPDDELGAFVDKVNADLAGKIFNKDGSPKDAYYQFDGETYFDPSTEVYDADGNEVMEIKLVGDTYELVLAVDFVNVDYYVDLDEAEAMLGGKIRLPNYESYELDFIEVSVNKFRMIAGLMFDNGSSKFAILCDPVTTHEQLLTFYMSQAPELLYAGDIEVYKFTFRGTPAGYKWRIDDMVYSAGYNMDNYPEEKVLAIIESMQ